ncbi:cytochrome p450 10-like [Plakobranchus ocellatus]|uniref:Cytochrome p450 10-like n=1 Tax=Plakobranchus ocellatus TaxID=259542 RepID=A0AAV3XX15_9GAST|nr:cytochrome p450 10-like [Plakobranchus ocellatus]
MLTIGGTTEHFRQGKAWYALRSPANKRLLKPGSASHYLSQQNEVADDLVEILSTRRLNAKEQAETFFKYASESIGVVCFNDRLGFLEPPARRSLETQRFSQASLKHFQLLMHSVTGESIAHKFYRNKTYREFEDTCNIMNEITDKYLHKAITELQMRKQDHGFNYNGPNLLYSFLSDSSLEYSQVKAIMNNLYNGGTDSTAKNLMVLLFNLARNPNKQHNLFQEINRVLGTNQPLTKEALANMSYLKACLKESFRLINPTALSAVRVLHHDTIIRGYRIPAGTSVAYSTCKSSRENFVDPERFLPERWLRTQTTQAPFVNGFRQRREEESHLLANIPFGYGLRGCLGRWFAEQEIYLAAVKILQKLEISIHPDSERTKFGYAIFVEPDKPIQFIFTPRERSQK